MGRQREPLRVERCGCGMGKGAKGHDGHRGLADGQTFLSNFYFVPRFCTVREASRRPKKDCGVIFRQIGQCFQTPSSKLFLVKNASEGRRRPSAPPPSPGWSSGCTSTSQCA